MRRVAVASGGTTTDWAAVTAEWVRDYGTVTFAAAKPEAIKTAASETGPFPDDLVALYLHCNGLTSGGFHLLPVQESPHLKRAWGDIQSANNAQTGHYLGGDEGLLKRFLVFAVFDDGGCAVIDRTDGSLWYEEQEELHRTTLSLPDFITTCLREMKDLSTSVSG